jgi:4-amino-4-deoxy-L-arabinose transferase-like glycosyltransferase
VFSFMSGIVHPYYTVVLAPAIGALTGAGVVDLWAWRGRSAAGGLVLGAAVAVTGIVAAALLGRTPDFVPWLGPAVAVGSIAAGVVLAVPAPRVTTASAAGRAAAALGAAALAAGIGLALAGPAAYDLATMERALAGGDPQPGPASAAGSWAGRSGGAGPGPGILPGGVPGDVPGDRPAAGGPPAPGAGGSDGALPGQGGPGGSRRPGVGDGGTLDDGVLAYLVANRGEATWLVAVPSAYVAGPIQLETGIPVMAMGGFSGSDPVPALDQLRAAVRSGALRFVMPGGDGRPGPGGARGSSDASTAIAAWVTDACVPVAVGGATGAPGAAAAAVYDCAGAAD